MRSSEGSIVAASEKSFPSIKFDARVVGVSIPENRSVGCEVEDRIAGRVPGTPVVVMPLDDDIDAGGCFAISEAVWLGG
jgi:hypothetical protein